MRWTVSVTPDMGVELGIPDAHGGSYQDYLGPWVRSRLQVEEDVPQQQQQQQQQRQRDEYALRNTIVSPGLLHIIDNMEHAMDKALPSFKFWLPGLQQINLLLRRKTYRDRFVETCVRPSRDHSAFEHLFHTNMPTTVEWRWGVIIDCLKCLKKLEHTFRATWSTEKFLEKGSVDDHEDDAGIEAGNEANDGAEATKKKEIDYDVITKTAKSNWWWTFAWTICTLHELAAEFRIWAEACDCHEWLMDADTDEAKELRRIRKDYNISDRVAGDGQDFFCPCKGMRCVALANNCDGQGRVAEVLQRVAEKFFAHVLFFCTGLTDAERADLISEWNAAKGVMILDLCNKLGVWQKLPWRLVLLAHHINDVARRAAREALAEFDASPQKEELHHRITWEFLSHGSHLRSLVELFASGPQTLAPRQTKKCLYVFVFHATSLMRNRTCSGIRRESCLYVCYVFLHIYICFMQK